MTNIGSLLSRHGRYGSAARNSLALEGRTVRRRQKEDKVAREGVPSDTFAAWVYRATFTIMGAHDRRGAGRDSPLCRRVIQLKALFAPSPLLPHGPTPTGGSGWFA